MNPSLPLLALAVHFVADFLLQTDWMAINKSKRWDALAVHCAVYAVCFAPFYDVAFAGITFAVHFITDAVTSRITSRLWFFAPVGQAQNTFMYVPGRRHWFFVVIGFDQLVHFGTLAWTLKLLASKL